MNRQNKSLSLISKTSKSNQSIQKRQPKVVVKGPFKPKLVNESRVPQKKQFKPIFRPPTKLPNPAQLKKRRPENDGIQGFFNQSKHHTEQIKKILIVVKNEQKEVDETANQKLEKIKKILGLQDPRSNKKNNIKNNVSEMTNYSTKCSGSKSTAKKQNDFDSKIKQKQQKQENSNVSLTEDKSQTSKQQNTGFLTSTKDVKKKNFDCQEIKRSMLKKYQLGQISSNKKSQNRCSRVNSHELKQLVEQDQRNSQNLMNFSPEEFPQSRNLRSKSNRKSILRKSMLVNQLSLQKDENKDKENQKKVNFSAEERRSNRKENVSNKKQ